eukprot:13453-Heterococcus_DN1.PRE.1
MDLVHRGDAASIDEDYETAIEIFSEAIEANPGLAAAYAGRAAAYNKLQRWQEGLADASKAVELDPSFEPAYFRKGNAAFELEDFQAALQAFEAGK